MPSPLDSAARFSSRAPSPAKSGRRIALAISVVLLASLGLMVQQGRPPEFAFATERSGGLGVQGDPQVKDVVCISRCVDTRKATVGSKIRVVGDYLNRVNRVVFNGDGGRVTARFEKREYGFVSVVVPQGAATGRVFVIAGDGTRSNRSVRELEVRPASEIPRQVFPVRGKVSFGSGGARFGAPRGGYSHQGQDVMAACGTRMVAARRSKVLTNKWEGAAGWYVVLKNVGTNTSFAYMHLRRKSPVKVGTVIGAGRPIGKVGQTGRAYGCHLHFEFWRGAWQQGGRPVDPLPYLKALYRK